MRRIVVTIVLLIPLGWCVTDVHSQRSAASEKATLQPVVGKITAAQMMTVMKEEGYAVSLDDDGDIVWKLDGYKTYMIVSDDLAELKFHAAFGDNPTPLETINKWNRTKKFSKTYIDDEKDPHIELDLDLEGGVTKDRLVSHLRTCRVSFTVWLREVVR